VFTAGVKQILAKNERVGKEKEEKRNKLLNDWSYSALGSHYSWGMEKVITVVCA
jgi:hypothetical protein